jgi:hypothetical protein
MPRQSFVEPDDRIEVGDEVVFATFCAAVMQMPCQNVKTGKRLIYRLLS